MAVDDRHSRAGLSIRILPTRDVERMMEAIQRPIVRPTTKVVIHGAFRRQNLGEGAPLASGAEDVHHTIDDLPDVHGPLVPTLLRGRDQRSNDRPLFVRQVAGVAQLGSVIASSVFCRLHTGGLLDSGRRH